MAIIAVPRSSSPALERLHEVPGTRFLLDWWRDPVFAAPPYSSIIEGVMEDSRQLAAVAQDAFMSGFASRTHAGQSAAGAVASGIHGSALRVPEMRSGSLVAVSI